MSKYTVRIKPKNYNHFMNVIKDFYAHISHASETKNYLIFIFDVNQAKLSTLKNKIQKSQLKTY